MADRLGVQRLALRVGEDRVVEIDRVTVSFLLAPPAGEGVFGGGVEVDAASAGAGLDWGFDRAAADGFACSGDGEGVGGVVPVAPAESGEFASSHAGGGGDYEGGVEAQVLGGVEECAGLVGGPAIGAQALAAPWLGRSGAVGGVGGDEVGVDGVVDGGAADDVDVVHGLGGKPWRRAPPVARSAV